VFCFSLRYNEAIVTNERMVILKTKYILELDTFEQRLLILSLNRLRNRVITDERTGLKYGKCQTVDRLASNEIMVPTRAETYMSG